MAGKCSTCHSGGFLTENAQQKSTAHVVTTAQCDTCHKSNTVWTGAAFVHDSTTVGQCNTCHKSGGAGLAMTTPPHIPTGTIQCDVCHTDTTVGGFLKRTMNHTAVIATACVTCHSGTYSSENANPVGAKHISLALGTVSKCDGCHTSRTDWTLRTMDHAGMAGKCSTCHMGGFTSENAQTFSPTHAGGLSPAQCDTCHKSTTVWTGATFVHPTNVAGTCNTCHKTGGTGLAMTTPPHIPTSTIQCDVCHTSTAMGGFLTRTMNHTAVTSTPCATCHSGAYKSENADGVGTTHILLLGTATTCNACHTSQTVWTLRTMDHGGLAGKCSTCHMGGYISENALTFSPTHAGGLSPAQCDTCHKSTTVWTGATFVHPTNVAGTCNTCHKTGGSGLAMTTPPHIPTSTIQCDVCHTSTAMGGFATRNMSHAAVTATPCATCHSGAYKSENADGVGTTHILLLGTATTCNACHTSQTVWTLRTMDHGGLAGKCSTCHMGGYISENALTFSPTHAGGLAPAQCDTCHKSTTDWTAATTFTHDATTVGKCSTCHTPGGAGMPVGATHILVPGIQCDNCHKSTVTGGFLTRTMNHTVVAATPCANCHGGSYVLENALAKVSNHIPDAPGTTGCNACHTSTAGTTVADWLTGEKMNHGAINGVTMRCVTCHLTGVTYMGKMNKKTMGNHENSKAGDDCVKSGCHRVSFGSW